MSSLWHPALGSDTEIEKENATPTPRLTLVLPLEILLDTTAHAVTSSNSR